MTKQRPTVTEHDLHGQKIQHPAFGAVEISRCSGRVDLFDSQLNHQYFISLRVRESTQFDNGQHKFNLSGKEIVEVYMSETQFARAITSIGMGGGAPCTINHREDQQVPGIIKESRRAKSEAGFQEMVGREKQLREELVTKLQEKLDEKKRPTLAEVKGLIQELKWMEGRFERNAGYAVDCFREHMEEAVEESKTEIENHILRSNQLVSNSVNQKRISEKHDRPEEWEIDQ